MSTPRKVRVLVTDTLAGFEHLELFTSVDAARLYAKAVIQQAKDAGPADVARIQILVTLTDGMTHAWQEGTWS